MNGNENYLKLLSNNRELQHKLYVVNEKIKNDSEETTEL